MKKYLLNKIILATLTCITTFLAYPTSVLAETGWTNHGPYWAYIDSDGSEHKGWLKDGDKWYYFDEVPSMVKGTKTIKGKTYFFSDSGELLKEIPTKQGIIRSKYADINGSINEVKLERNSGFKNAKMYFVNGKYNLAKFFNSDGTIASNTVVIPIGDDGKEWHPHITDEFGYYADIKTKLELNGRVYIEIDDGFGGESNRTTTDPDTGETLYITSDKSLGNERHPMCLAKDEWWYGYGYYEGWHYINSMNKMEKNVWKQNDEKTKWFYLNENGKMVMNKWIQSEGNWYYMGTDGHMLTNTTIRGYYLDDVWHYVSSNRYLPTDTTVNEYYFGTDGVYQP